MSDEEPSARLFVVSGRVQGVGFRYFVWNEAVAIGVRGWVRNRPEGTVEVAAWGGEEQLDALNAVLSNGPRWSTVIAVDREEPPTGEAPAGPFSIRS